jgi:tetratricopeptide (TPR) repeat protein
MSEKIFCPDCGRPNEPNREFCEGCGFPLGPDASRPRDPAPAPQAAPAPPERIPPVLPQIARPLPHRPRGRAADPMAAQLWIMFGVIAAAAVLFIGIKAVMDRKAPSAAVTGATEDQQKSADSLLLTLERDSTNVDARIGLANLYYDTGNWAEAARHYTRAVARDSSRVDALVDLGVCDYNMGQSRSAERHFQLALAREPHHPIALFNLGIVAEKHERLDEALEYYHRCLASQPPEEMRPALDEAMARLQQKTGRSPVSPG